MPRRPSPFSTHMEGPRTPREIAFDREMHRKREQERLRNTERPEDQPTLVDVRNYLKQRGLVKLCPTLQDCKPANVEPVLVEDMHEAQKKHDEEQVLKLRRLVWADSRQVNTNDSPRRAEAITRHLLAEALRKQQELERYDADAAKEMEDEIADIRKVLGALRKGSRGKDLEAETSVIEEHFAYTLQMTQSPYEDIRKKAARELSGLRIIRDELYFSRCFPVWAKLRSQMMHDDGKKVGS